MDFISITKLLSDDYYAVPDYQRDYEWTNAENSVLIEDVLEAAKQDTNHFLGAIVTIPYETETANNKTIDLSDFGIKEKDVKHIVDGQQRLISITILMRALIDSIDRDSYAKTNKQIEKLKTVIMTCIYGIHIYKNDTAPRLILNGNTGNYYNKEILGIGQTTGKKNYRGVKHISAAYKLYSTEIEKNLYNFIKEGICKDSVEYYSKIMTTLIGQMQFVEIECDQSSNAFQVFDSLNGKGLDLTAADRIKNIFMSWAPTGKGSQYWSALSETVGEDFLVGFFVSLFFYSKGKRVGKDKLPETFRTSYEIYAKRDFDLFYTDLIADAEIYGKIKKYKTLHPDLDSEMLPNFSDLKMDQVNVILFAVIKHFGNITLMKGKAESKDFIELVKQLETLLVKMQICEMSANKLDNIFSECIKLMKDSNYTIANVASRIQDYSSQISSNEFKESFKSFTTSDTKVARYYLRKIEAFLRKQNHSTRGHVDRVVTVEHIIPQKLKSLSDWYGKTKIDADIEEEFDKNFIIHIGNMALLYADDNSSASNDNYGKKRKVYSEGKQGQDQGTPVGTFELIVELLKDYPKKFNHKEILTRAEKMADYAVKIWK